MIAASLPNLPMNGSQWKICTNSYCNGPPIASGQLTEAWGVGEWHRLSLMTGTIIDHLLVDPVLTLSAVH